MSFLNKFKKQESVSNSALETCVFALSITDLQTLLLVIGHSINVTMEIFSHTQKWNLRHINVLYYYYNNYYYYCY